MTTIEYFRLFAPAYSSVSDDTVNKWIAIAEIFVPTKLTGEILKMAQALYAAHALTLTDTDSVGVKSEKEGDLSRTYNDPPSSASQLMLTSYGHQYLDLVRPYFGIMAGYE